jgi:hypothetical protein
MPQDNSNIESKKNGGSSVKLEVQIGISMSSSALVCIRTKRPDCDLEERQPKGMATLFLLSLPLHNDTRPEHDLASILLLICDHGASVLRVIRRACPLALDHPTTIV